MSRKLARQILKKPLTILEKIVLTQQYYNSRSLENRSTNIFDNIEKFCLFIGYPRSGHSLIGSLLDAHPNIVISHELDVLKYIQAGFIKKQIFYFILENSRKFTLKGREWTGYSYQVANQWQGKYSSLKIIGDKKGGKTTERLAADPSLLKELRETIDSQLKFIHVTRNPYDNISRMSIVRQDETQSDLLNTIDQYFQLASTVKNLKKTVKREEILDIPLESLIQDPESELKRLTNFLDISVQEEYLIDCAAIIFPTPKKSRYNIDWDSNALNEVTNRIDSYSFLKNYDYDS